MCFPKGATEFILNREEVKKKERILLIGRIKEVEHGYLLVYSNGACVKVECKERERKEGGEIGEGRVVLVIGFLKKVGEEKFEIEAELVKNLNGFMLEIYETVLKYEKTFWRRMEREVNV